MDRAPSLAQCESFLKVCRVTALQIPHHLHPVSRSSLLALQPQRLHLHSAVPYVLPQMSVLSLPS